MPFYIVRQDITKMKVDAVVNAANTGLLMGGGVCGAIFKAAGIRELSAACAEAAPIKTGHAAITPGFSLPCRYIIHAAGPIYSSFAPSESEKLLRSAYTESLKLASANGCESIAFPLISSGIYGYPKAEALAVASSAIRDFIAENDIEVYLAVFSRDVYNISKALLGDIESYIDDNYTEPLVLNKRRLLDVEAESIPFNYNSAPTVLGDISTPKPKKTLSKSHQSAQSIDELVGKLDEAFGATLLRLIDAKGKTDIEVYKRANLDRKLFSKIRSGKDYTPGKRTILALAIALELSLSETDELLNRAGYALSHSRKFDVIIEYFIINGRYDIFEINEVLFKYDQPLLGG